MLKGRFYGLGLERFIMYCKLDLNGYFTEPRFVPQSSVKTFFVFVLVLLIEF